MNTGLRMVYPFLPELARGTGTSLGLLSALVAGRSLVGLAGPAFGPLSDRHGRRPVLIGALVLMAIGCLAAVLRPGLAGLALALSAVALAKVIYDPALQGFVGDRVPYERRGRALALTEFSWSGALLVGAPICGWLIARGAWGPDGARPAWTLPFLALGLGALLGALAVRVLMPRHGAGDARAAPGSRASALRALRKEPAVRYAVLFVALIMAGNEVVLLSFGPWMESSFGLDLGALGLAAVVIGGAEIGGEATVAALADRVGKRRLLLVASLVGAAAYAAVPLVGGRLAAALATLFLAFFCFEVYFVGSLPILTELVPGARGAVMSLSVAAMSLGRAAGALAAAPVWQRGGAGLAGLLAASLTLLGLAALFASLRAHPPRSSPTSGA